MDVRGTSGGERMLRRIIAQLVASAVLAERAAGRSLLVRWIVLWVLRRAESTALDYVFVETGMPLAVEEFALAGNGPDDAFALAARFRALAAALVALLPLACLFARPSAPGFAFGPVAPGAGRGPGEWTREPYDTS